MWEHDGFIERYNSFIPRHIFDTMAQEQKIESLRDELEEMSKMINLCVGVINSLIYNSKAINDIDIMQFHIEGMIDRLDELNKKIDEHQNNAHAMLIVGNKEKDENESNIP